MSGHPHARMFPGASPLPGPLVPDLKLVCSWCDVVIREGAEPESHGICPACADKMREDHDMKKREKDA